jgi:hypothetical protein
MRPGDSPWTTSGSSAAARARSSACGSPKAPSARVEIDARGPTEIIARVEPHAYGPIRVVLGVKGGPSIGFRQIILP